MPDEEDAEFGACASGEETVGEEVGGGEEKERREEGEDGGAVNDQGRRRHRRTNPHCQGGALPQYEAKA